MAGGAEVFGKNQLQCHFVTADPLLTILGLNHGGKLANSQLIYGTMHCLECDTNFILLTGSGDVTNARDRLKGALQELLDQSDDSSLSSHDDASQSDVFNQQMAIKKPLSVKSYVISLSHLA